MDRTRLVETFQEAAEALYGGYRVLLVYTTVRDCDAALNEFLDLFALPSGARVLRQRRRIEYGLDGACIDFRSLSLGDDQFRGQEWHCVNPSGAVDPVTASRVRMPL